MVALWDVLTRLLPLLPITVPLIQDLVAAEVEEEMVEVVDLCHLASYLTFPVAA